MDTKQIDVTDTQEVKTVTGFKSKKIYVIGAIAALAIVGVVLTATLAPKKKNEDNKEADDAHLAIKIGEKYEGLNYTREKETLVDEGFFYNYNKNQEGSKIDVSYIKVDGLIEDSLEKMINTTLKIAAESHYDENNLSDSNVLYDHISNYTDVYIFNNVLSTMYKHEFCDIEGNTKIEYFSININLKDNKEFKLEDVFINNADLSTIIPGYNSDMTFCVSPKFVYYVDSSNKVQKVSLYENSENVAIYNRFFDNKRLFEKTYKSYPYAYTVKNLTESDVYGIQDGNVFIDTVDKLIGLDYPQKVIDEAYKLYKDGVNRGMNLAYSNPSKRYLIQLVPSIDKEDDDTYTIKVKYVAVNVDKNFFINSIDEFIVASENKSKSETETVNYLENPPLNGSYYLNGIINDTLRKQVNKEGEEITTNVTTSAGIS